MHSPASRLSAVCRHLGAGRMDVDSFDYDLVTIGAGSGGVRASRVSSATYGAKVRSAMTRKRAIMSSTNSLARRQRPGQPSGPVHCTRRWR